MPFTCVMRIWTPWIARARIHKEEEEQCIGLGIQNVQYNSDYNTEMINKQCNEGYPLETPGGL